MFIVARTNTDASTSIVFIVDRSAKLYYIARVITKLLIQCTE